MKWIKFTTFCILIVGAAAYTAIHFGGWEVRRLEAEVDHLQEERRRLAEYAQRLGAVRRVAQVDVIRQHLDDSGRLVNTLLWQEIGPDGLLGKPLALETVGEQVYFEAFVIKFETRFVGEGDPLRGASLAMFRRVFGESQIPESVPDLDRLSHPPLRTDPATTDFQRMLWQRFWEIADQPRLAEQFGVRIAQCEAPAVRLAPGQTWEVALDAVGGLNLHRIGDPEQQVAAPLITSYDQSLP